MAGAGPSASVPSATHDDHHDDSDEDASVDESDVVVPSAQAGPSNVSANVRLSFKGANNAPKLEALLNQVRLLKPETYIGTARSIVQSAMHFFLWL